MDKILSSVLILSINSDILSKSTNRLNKLIFKKYKSIKKINFGSFSNIYSVIRLEDKNVFAMKILINNTNNYISRNLKSLHDKDFENNNQK